MQQLALQFHHDECDIREYLEGKINRSVSLVITDNSTSMLSIRCKEKTLTVRLHRIFLSAGMEALNEIAAFIKNRKSRTPHIRNFINRNTHRLRTRPQGRVRISTEGKCYDLSGIYNSLNQEYFGGRISASITWGRVHLKRAVRKRTLGSYSHHNNLIRVNPILDTKKVPRYFLEYIVYHEMLHADIGVVTVRGRRSVHSGEFREREKIFKQYRSALEWEQKRWK